MNNAKLLTLDETINEINKGKLLIIAGIQGLLKHLPAGNWIGGSIPYFMTNDGGKFISNKLLVTDFSELAVSFKINVYEEKNINKIPEDYYSHGFSYILIPGASSVMKKFALDTEKNFQFFNGNLVGWVTGTDLNKLNSEPPLVIDGKSLKAYTNAAVVAHVELPNNLQAKINIINIFEQGDGDIIIFPDDTFEIFDCYINGEKQIFTNYLREKNIDKSHPLVVNYNGVPINVSIKDINDYFVETFTPVRRGVRYKFAKRLDNYAKEFAIKIPQYNTNVVASCNCIYNYIFGELENKKLPYIGPFTFGEIAYILLNQTMVNLEIIPTHS